METIKLLKGQRFIQRGEHLKYLYVLASGKVQAQYKTDAWEIEPGSIIGLLECDSQHYLCDYVALTDSVLLGYAYEKPEDFFEIFAVDKKYISVFAMAAMRQTAFYLKRYKKYLGRAHSYYGFLMSMYHEYDRFCADYHTENLFKKIEQAKPFLTENPINECIVAFYEKFAGMPLKNVQTLIGYDENFSVGEILNGTAWMVQAINLIEDIREYILLQKEILISDREDSLYQRYFELLQKASEEGMDVEPLQEILVEIMDYARDCGIYEKSWLDSIFKEYEEYDFSEMGLRETAIWDEYEEDILLTNCMEQILKYAEFDGESAEAFFADVAKLKKLSDPYSTEDDVRQMRKRLTKNFYIIYKKVFQRTLEDPNIPNAIKMFLNFGFMDIELAGEDTAKSLNDMVEKLFLCKEKNVYTIYEWLLSIYNRENEPSKNEFDLDYVGYLTEQRKTGRITVAEEKELLEDGWKRVEYEIDNMMMTNSRLTYGKILSFCPLLCEYDVINSVEKMLVTAEKINEAINYIRSIDYSVFYRGVVFSDPERDINMEVIEKEVLPNVILIPNTGSRAMMWQETAGIKRDTPARFIFPILTVANVQEMMIDVAGRYRWEICRKIQGVRWNDITDPSLTSEYNDYIQYFRKNHDLSTEAKEKIKNILQKSKNNFREVFVKDYQNWINYEAKGSFRLNKVAREIIFKYCPFSKHIRQELKINPMYQEMFGRFDMKREKVVRRLENLYDRYQKKGGEITKELQDNREFYDL